MKKIYLFLSAVGFFVPASFMLAYTKENPDNFMFIMDIDKTMGFMFGNYGSASLSSDLLVVMAVFGIWVFMESRKLGIKYSWIFIISPFVVGLSGPFPLFLYFRERVIERNHG